MKEANALQRLQVLGELALLLRSETECPRGGCNGSRRLPSAAVVWKDGGCCQSARSGVVRYALFTVHAAYARQHLFPRRVD